MLYYTAIVFITAFSLGIMILGVQGNRFIPLVRKRGFQVLFALLILANLAEWLATYLNGAASSLIAMHIGTKFVELMLTPIIPFACAFTIRGDKYAKLMCIPIGINTILQIASLFTGIIFYIDAENLYYRGPGYPVYVILFSLAFVFLIIHCSKFSQRYQHQNLPFLSMIMVLVTIAVAMPLIVSDLRLDWSCVSIAAVMFYIYYDQLVQQVDDLTALLNRRSYDCQIEHFHEKATILFFDVDNFKEINDSYGHHFGDQCLILVGKEIKQVFEKYGHCFRFGGDEFCAILTRNLENTEELISRYLHRTEKLRLVEPRLPRVSVGYAIFEPTKEPISEAINRADQMMYQLKNDRRETQS